MPHPRACAVAGKYCFAAPCKICARKHVLPFKRIYKRLGIMDKFTPEYKRAEEQAYEDMRAEVMKHAPAHQNDYLSKERDEMMNKNVKKFNKKTSHYYKSLQAAYEQANLNDIEQVHTKVTQITQAYYQSIETFLQDSVIPSKMARGFKRKKKHFEYLSTFPIERKTRNWGGDEEALNRFKDIYNTYFENMQQSYSKSDFDKQKAARKDAYDIKVAGLKDFFEAYPFLDIRPSAADRKKEREARVTARVAARKAQKEAEAESKQTRGSQNSSAAGASKGRRARAARTKYGAASKP